VQVLATTPPIGCSMLNQDLLDVRPIVQYLKPKRPVAVMLPRERKGLREVPEHNSTIARFRRAAVCDTSIVNAAHIM
jgi:hypothetical protein